MSAPTLTFLGAAGTVTGSKYLVDTGAHRVLLDCGLFQGLKALRLRNWEPPSFDPKRLDAVVLSHAHLDHSGALPTLARAGFRGPVYCTPGTADLLRVVLPDSARLQEDDAAHANRHGYSKHRPAKPLFTADDVDTALRLVRPVTYHQPFSPAPGVEARFARAGHILGAAIVQLDVAGHRVVFSGDLGRWNRPILNDPEFVETADTLLVESTYGDRVHRTDEADTLARVITETAARGGAVIVPAFAIGRTQELLWLVRQLEADGRIPRLPVFLDSPMGLDVTDVYLRHADEHDPDMKRLTRTDGHPLRPSLFRRVESTEASKALNRHDGPAVIIAGSGMATGGRVLHHLAHRLPDARTSVLLTGYQAAGTRGRMLQSGAPFVRIHGRDVAVKARVETIDGLSAHADRDDLRRWFKGFRAPPRTTSVVHGEPASAQALATLLTDTLGWAASVASDGASVSLR